MRFTAWPALIMAARRAPIIDFGTGLLVLIGIVRMFVLVLHDPMLGYANQYDMARTSACVDLWPSLPAPERYEAHLSAPLPYDIERHARAAHCYRSSVVVFVLGAKFLIAVAHAAGLVPEDRFPLQAVGVAGALALIVLVLAFLRAERARPWARLAHASIFAVVLTDPANTLWLNTLYTEPAALFFAYAVAGLLALKVITHPGRAAATAMIVAL
ncbi:MAG: hypothetical protein ACM338_10465, partial [Betaproteobacteria bacterium]